jgi:hypothetical protein
MKVVHLTNSGPRGPATIIQGLLALGVDLSLNEDYVSLGKLIKPASHDIRQQMLRADLIFGGDDDAKVVSNQYSKFLHEQNLWKKVIWYDFRDSCEVDPTPLACAAAYFKRSVVRKDRSYIESPIRHLDYAALDEYYTPENHQRDIKIAAYFHPTNDLGLRRNRLVREMKQAGLPVSITCDGRQARRAIEQPLKGNCFLDYLHNLHRTQIVFTAFPENHDGDSRTWEAFASGALVFRDKSYIRHEYPLVNGKHFFEYDATDGNSIKEAIARAQSLTAQEIERIAQEGFGWIREHHRPVNRVQEMIAWIKRSN